MRDDGDAVEDHVHEDDDGQDDTPSRQHGQRILADGRNNDVDDDESMLDDAELAGSTPRPKAAARGGKVPMPPAESPYEVMRREMKHEEDGDETTALEDDDDEEEEEDSSILFAQHTARLPDMSLTPKGLLDQRRHNDPSTGGKDPLLHRVLDKNYRIQATPHRPAAKGTPVRSVTASQRQAWQDSPASSPEMAIPQLRSAAFMSPYKSLTAGRRTGGAASAVASASASSVAGVGDGRQRFTPVAATSQGPRTPGVSVQTPMSKKTRQALADGSLKGKQKYEIDWESDEDDDLYGGMSPPKTIQFALPPSKLLRTPGTCTICLVLNKTASANGHALMHHWKYSSRG